MINTILLGIRCKNQGKVVNSTKKNDVETLIMHMLMLGHRLWRRPNIKPSMGQHMLQMVLV